MKKIIILLAALTTMLVSNAFAKDATLSMAYTNALGDELPFSIFTKQSWSPAPKTKYVKLHLYFDEPIMVKGLEIDTCGTLIDQGLSIFFNFDQWILHTDPALAGEIPDALYPKKKDNLLILDGFKQPIEVRSLTFNFERSASFKICGIHLKDLQGTPYNIKTPLLIGGTAAASSTLPPATAYDPIFLFDSRFEYGWASNKQAKNVDLSFTFEQPQTVEKIRIWNGYQRSVNHCQANSRARIINISGDGGYSASISVKDVLGSQVISLPKPFTGKQLKFEIADSFPGKTYKDLVVSELRFFNGKDWFMLNPAGKLKEGIAANRSQFEQANLAPLLSDSYTGTHTVEDDESEVFSEDTTVLRLRADGSFYLSGSHGNESSERSYFALGNYEIKNTSADPKKGMRLRLFGILYQSEVYGDCNGCGRDCNKSDDPDGPTQKIFQEIISLKPAENGQFAMDNESGGKKLPFKHLPLRREAIKP